MTKHTHKWAESDNTRQCSLCGERQRTVVRYEWESLGVQPISVRTIEQAALQNITKDRPFTLRIMK